MGYKFVIYSTMKSPGVYRIHCKATKKNYVGSSSTDWKNRRNGHIFLLKKGTHPSKSMQNDWNTYGPSEFFFVLVCECEKSSVLSFEKAAADEYKAFDAETGYNTAPISPNRFRAGRRPSAKGYVRFSRMVKPETALALSQAIDADGLLRLEHGPTKGWKYGPGDGTQKTVGFSHPSYESPEAITHGQGPIGMVTQDSSEVVRLKARVKELEHHITKLES